MHNPIDMALTKVVSSIPHEILHAALLTANKRYNESNHLASFISQHIIAERVYKDCNISGGLVKTICLQGSWIERGWQEHGGMAGDDGAYTVFRIPPEYRDNMPISSILCVQYPYNVNMAGGLADMNMNSGGYSMVDMISDVLGSQTLATPRNHPVGFLLSGDLIKIVPSQYAMQNWLVTVRINYDKQFTGLHNSAIPILQDLVLLATKQWCYTNLIVQIDRAAILTGTEVGTFKSIVEEYRDAGQMYDETLVKWRGVSQMAPDVRMRLLAYML